MDKDFNLTKAEAKKLILVEDEMVHTFYNPSIGLIGGDHSEASILQDIEEAERLNLAGEAAQKMGHALAILKNGCQYQSDILFVATKSDEVEKLLKRAHKIAQQSAASEGK